MQQAEFINTTPNTIYERGTLIWLGYSESSGPTLTPSFQPTAPHHHPTDPKLFRADVSRVAAAPVTSLHAYNCTLPPKSACCQQCQPAGRGLTTAQMLVGRAAAE